MTFVEHLPVEENAKKFLGLPFYIQISFKPIYIIYYISSDPFVLNEMIISYTGSAKKMYTHFNKRKFYVLC